MDRPKLRLWTVILKRPKLLLWTVILDRPFFLLLFFHPNGRHISVNLDHRPIGLSIITDVGCNFKPSKSTVVERNFGPSKIMVVDRNFGPSKITDGDRDFEPSKITIVGRCFGPSKITVADRNFGFFFLSFKWMTYIRKFGPASNLAVQNYSCGL